jgi:hypothetical protein
MRIINALTFVLAKGNLRVIWLLQTLRKHKVL